MPAEWHPHAATLLHWPSNRETWPGDRLERVEAVFLEILDTLHRFEPVVLIVDPESAAHASERITARKLDRSRIRVLEQPINDLWARDCGPIFVRRERGGQESFLITDWEYNAWGGKYPPWEDDNRIPSFLSEQLGVPSVRTGSILEGGAIETNGKGVFLTTEAVLLNPNRYASPSREKAERMLSRWLGAVRVIWLGEGLAGDDTDGHVDDLCRFLDERTILTAVSPDPLCVNHDVLAENLKRLRMATDPQGRPFRIVELPLPETGSDEPTVDGSERVPASYANFYIANGVVLVPVYGCESDRQALELLQRHFPDRKVAGIDCSDLVWGQGSIHCITQQLYGFAFSDSCRS